MELEGLTITPVHFQGNFWVTVFNLAFTFVAMFHLAYLGIMFGGDDIEAQQEVTQVCSLGMNSQFVSDIATVA